MEILFVMVPVMLLIMGLLVGFFLWAVRSGQMEDLESQKYRILWEQDSPKP